MSTTPMHDRPLAAHGLTSYRLKDRYGWIMIGARNHEEAMSEAARSTDAPRPEALQVWDGLKYIDVEWNSHQLLHVNSTGEIAA
ncbi:MULTISPECIES: hypothetical protein [Paraburkholderia]|uniref:Uncharacterized protein n=1 Tax=Paraburkholderia madseniana TaxID=2599607 RepID=A0AAP5BJU3_9BURK|nr:MULTISPECIES: hypothetical protein [Paraburkholderia]MCX4150002.1 hypothetical protein [Paraburkholderia madseniana]MDN7152938.1 hypothetical protein [Paraburkholderia sp. WS6]MDQ6411820.1 hypothetical protein [Paraburkholderia madseniana]